MNYADSCCKYIEVYEPVHAYAFTGKCIVTKKEVTVVIPAKELYAYRKGALIQNAMPSVSKTDRELNSLCQEYQPRAGPRLSPNRLRIEDLGLLIRLAKATRTKRSHVHGVGLTVSDMIRVISHAGSAREYQQPKE